MKKRIKPITAVLLLLALLCAAPHAFAARDSGVNPLIAQRLTELRAVCGAVREEQLTLNGSSLAAFEKAEAELSQTPATDAAAIAVIRTAQALLGTVEVTSAYGLTEALDNLYSFDDALFRDRFAYPYTYESESKRDDDRETYEELYYHFRDDGTLDWVLTHTTDSNPQPWECYIVLGSRVLHNQSGDLPFAFGYSVYDAVTGRFQSLLSAYETYERGGYAGLAEAMDACHVGDRRGDTDGDGRLTIKDATQLQRYLAELEAFPSRDRVQGFDYRTEYTGSHPLYLSDYNRNGVRDIGDVTAIQKALAEWENQ